MTYMPPFKFCLDRVSHAHHHHPRSHHLLNHHAQRQGPPPGPEVSAALTRGSRGGSRCRELVGDFLYFLFGENKISVSALQILWNITSKIE